MMKLLIAAACAAAMSGAAMAQATSTGAGEQVNPGTNPAVGRDSTFGMNNMGDPKTGDGLHGGKTSDTYDWLKEKRRTNERDARRNAGEPK
ncbi:hypothetical protein ACTZWT_06855 [Rhodopseudomonas sp. NSM]|uniref:hypothetical protein n=1 Tax=Rhodopseudomonas sp. NSM TaxID=3457630 RepID=UPI0040352E52